MKSSSQINVAVIGVGNMGYHHARNYAEIEGVRLVAVVDADETRGRSVARQFGCGYYANHHDLLAHEPIDAVSLAVPTGLHGAMAQEIMAAHVHLLVEKPLATSVAEAQALVRTSREMGVVLAVGHIERFNPAVQELKRRIEGDELGAITSIVAKRVGVLPPQVKDADVIIDLAVHDIDILNYLLGKMPTQVYATAGRALLSDRFDHAELFLKYEQVGCFIQVNWITPIKIRTLSVTGNAGYAELNYVTQKLDLYQSNLERQFDNFGEFIVRFGTPQSITVPIAPQEPLRLELESFLASIRGRPSSGVSGEDGVRALLVAEQAVQHLQSIG
jgi:UDP-N-acetylglucosamine 3-dehydrogenase